MTQTVDDFFAQNWPFESAKAIKKFRAAGFSRVTCHYFPEALDDRIEYACRLLTLLFLVDGMSNLDSVDHRVVLTTPSNMTRDSPCHV